MPTWLVVSALVFDVTLTLFLARWIARWARRRVRRRAIRAIAARHERMRGG